MTSGPKQKLMNSNRDRPHRPWSFWNNQYPGERMVLITSCDAVTSHCTTHISTCTNKVSLGMRIADMKPHGRWILCTYENMITIELRNSFVWAIYKLSIMRFVVRNVKIIWWLSCMLHKRMEATDESATETVSPIKWSGKVAPQNHKFSILFWFLKSYRLIG